jgi:hypothetical protein
MINLLQKHTVDLYDFKNKEFESQKIYARKLITFSRFDLFAKITYIKYRSSNPDYARRIYSEHIKVFNPDLKEPGRDDKNGLEDFITSFDKLIDYFEGNEFDSEVSLIPVSEGGEILDGSHRIAALAYFDKEVKIVKFKGVQAVAKFDYNYFIKRGLSIKIADTITYEGFNFVDNLFVACLWPKMGDIQKRSSARECFKKHFKILYQKDLKMSLDNLSMFIYEIYNHQDWVGTKENNYAGARDKAFNCYATNRTVQFIVFKAASLEEVLKVKDDIRKQYQLDKHALHITDNDEETKEIFDLILTDKVNGYTSGTSRFVDRFIEFKAVVKNVYLISLKVKIARILKLIGVYK